MAFYHCSSLPLGRWRIAKRGLGHLALRQPAPGPVALLKQARDITKMRFALTLGFSAQGQRSREIMLHFEHETVGSQSKSFLPIAGNFSIASEDNNKVIVIDGRKWLQGQTSAGVAERTKTLYGERSAESLSNVKPLRKSRPPLPRVSMTFGIAKSPCANPSPAASTKARASSSHQLPTPASDKIGGVVQD